MSQYSLALSDKLLKVYFDFKAGSVSDACLLEKFLSYYHAPFITSVNQLEAINHQDNSLMPQLTAQGYISDTLEQLAQKTIYKIILNTERSDYPYVNILNDKIEKNFSLSFKCSENRNKAHDLIRALCADATSILIYDKYFIKQWSGAKSFFNLLPDKTLTIFYIKNQLQQTQITELKSINAQWIIKQDTRNKLKNSHDRYLIIDNRIEIILSSGFDYLFDTSKDLNCLVREVK
ncbi:MAG: hypothetical protein WAX77_16235 [Methylococcaceae bacterium]